MMKVLVLTRSAINSDDNMGNTIENLLGTSDQIELHNIFMRAGAYKNTVCKTVYQISEQKLIKSIFNGSSCGEEVHCNTSICTDEMREKKTYDFAKKYDFYIFWFVRELLWQIGHWKTQTLTNYLNKINPDIIFMPSFNCWYPYKVLNFIKQHSNAKVVLYHADDNYSMANTQCSPFYWLYKVILRKYLKKSIKTANLNFCISKEQVEEYSNIFDIECDLLQKFADFEEQPSVKHLFNEPLRLIYTGNISSGRWTTLALIGRALQDINRNSIKAQLYIYSGTTLTNEMKRALFIPEAIIYKGSIAGNDIPRIQRDADILVHCESFFPNDVTSVRLSFSTKIIDYLTRGRCILAIGPGSVSSIRYFIANNAGFVINDRNLIKDGLLNLINNHDLISKKAISAWQCGQRNHNKSIIQKMFIEKLEQIIEKN